MCINLKNNKFEEGINFLPIQEKYNNLLNLSYEHTKIGLNFNFLIDKECLEINAHINEVGKDNYNLFISRGTFVSMKTVFITLFDCLLESDFNNYKYSYDTKFINLYFEDDDKSKYLNKLFGEVIDCLIFHELGHVVLGHITYTNKTFYESENISTQNSFVLQNFEMQADWYGCYRAFQVGLYSNKKFVKEKNYNSPTFYWILRREYTSILLSEIILFYSFSNFGAPDNGINLSLIDFKKLSHPHPYVRVAYLFDSAYEACFNIVSQKTSLNSDICKKYVEKIEKDSYGDLKIFLKNPRFKDLLNIVKHDEIMKVYKIIRSKKNFENTTPLIDFHLTPIEDE